MNQELIEMAEQARDYADDTYKNFSNNSGWFELYNEKFAALVAAAEREACARVCDEQADELYESIEHHKCAKYLAEQIRARGNT